jgi:S1-C subfamily serine protease
MRTSELIRFRCSGCQQLYEVLPALANERAKCRRCGTSFQIPSSSAEALNGRRPGQAAADRLTAYRIAGARECPSRKQFSSLILTLGSIAGVLSATVLGIAVFQTDSSPAFSEHLERGRVAKLSAPRSKFEFASATELIEAVEPAVVWIRTDTGSSSGFLIDESGLIVTCYHCIENASGGRVMFKDQSEAPIVGVRRIAPERDLAVIQIETKRPLVSLPLLAESPKKGEPVIALGSPAGLSFTVSEGSISAVRTGAELRILSREFADAIGSAHWYRLSPAVRLVQITATTMPGNSGGPIVDFRGNVIGVSAFGLNWHGQMLGFCISARDILDVTSQLDTEPTPLRELTELSSLYQLLPRDPWEGFPPKILPPPADLPPGPLPIQ